VTANSPAVSLCIINFNGAQHLRLAFDALQKQDWEFAEILVVDNASEDDSRAVVRQLCPRARLIELAENLGPGTARNAGFAAASHDLILFQDNDVQLNPGTVKRLLDCLSGRRSGQGRSPLAIAPRVLHAADSGIVQFDSADCHFLGLMATRNTDVPVSRPAERETPSQTTSIVTACFLIDREAWNGTDLFDGSFGFNLEDHDFGVRARIYGHGLWVDPGATVLHGSGTPGLSYRPGLVPSECRIFYLIRNRWIVIGKCYSVRTLIVLAPALVFYELLQLAWLLRNRQGHIWWRAAGDLTGQRKRILAARRAVQRQRRVTDAGILRDGPLPITAEVRERAGRYGLPWAERLLRGYWRLTRSWI
jgi:GT2 family glycosyltransferase